MLKFGSIVNSAIDDKALEVVEFPINLIPKVKAGKI